MAESPIDDLHRQFFEKNRAVQLLIDPETGAIVDANPAAASFYGYERSRLRALRITDINTLPAEEVRRALAQASAERRTLFQCRHRLASGELRDVEVHCGPVDLARRRLLYSIVHDVTDRRRAEEALSRSDERYREILEGIEEGYYEVDLEGNFTFVNAALCLILGRAARGGDRANDHTYTAEASAKSSSRGIQPHSPHGRQRAARGLGDPQEGRHRSATGRLHQPDARYAAAGPWASGGGAGRDGGARGAQRLQEALYAITEVSSAGLDLPAFYRAIHEIVGELLNARNFYIALRDEAHGRPRLPVLRGRPVRSPRRGGPAGSA